MNFFTVVRLAITRILANKTRSALTVLGVVIGVGALVGLVSIAQGATSGINSSLSSLGGNKVTISSSTATGLDQRDENDLASIAGVSATSYEVTEQGSATAGGSSATVTITGVSPSYFSTADPDIKAGSYLSSADVAQQSRTVVLGSAAADALDVTTSDIGSAVSLAGQRFTVVGILDDSSGFSRGGGAVYIPLQTARTIYAPSPYLSGITLVADDAADVDGIVTGATSTLQHRYHITDSNDAEFTVTNQASLVSSLSSISTILELLIGGIASISLLVGGVGIMNIMLVSVRERTREIGIRRAIGAKRSTILVQFLVEAVVLSVLGGVIGLVLGSGLAFLVSLIGGWAFDVAGWVIALSLGFSVLVGIVFGVGPARAAARMLPVEALRYE